MVRWMATRCFGRFSNFPKAERHISANACQWTWAVALTWRRRSIESGTRARTWNKLTCHATCPSSSKEVLFRPLPGQFRNLKWWLTKLCVDHFNIFYVYAEMGNNQGTEMQLEFQDSPNPPVFVTTPKVGGTGLNLTAANHAIISQKFWVLNEHRQAFARVVRQVQNRVPHTWLLNTGPGGFVTRDSDLHQLSGVAEMWLLRGLLRRPNITTSMIYRILDSRKRHTKQLAEHGDVMPSYGEDEWLLSGQWNQGTPL